MKRKHINPNCQCASCKSKRGESFGKNASNYKDGHCINNKCKYCKTKISPQAKMCELCYYSIKKRLQKGKNNSNYKHGEYLKKHFCIECKEEISLNNFLYGKKLCAKCYLNKLKFPENHPCYIDGRSFEPYPLEFNQVLKEFIRKRDNYECQNCNMTEEEHLIVMGTVLHVHHIDYNKINCKENNLITTCQQCNSRANTNRDYWKDFYSNKILLRIL